MAGTKTKVISLTDKASGYAFKLGANEIINFFGINSNADSNITYIGENGNLVTRDVDETPSSINTAAAKTFAVTLVTGETFYLNADRLVYFGDLGASRQIMYYRDSNVLQQIYVTTSASAINTAAGNTFAVTLSADGTTKYLNCNNIASISSNGAVRPAILSVLFRAESATLDAAGSGYAPADTIQLAGGTPNTPAVISVTTTQLIDVDLNAIGTGYAINDTITLAGGAGTIKAIVTVDAVDGGGAILSFSITTPGSYTTNAATFTQFSTTGSGTGATFTGALYGVNTFTIATQGLYSALPANPVSQQISSGAGTGAQFDVSWEIGAITIVDGGLGYAIAPTITITGDGSGATATATIVNGSVNHISVTAAGAAYTTATATASGGAGAIIMYDEKAAAFAPVNVSQTAAALQTTINAL